MVTIINCDEKKIMQFTVTNVDDIVLFWKINENNIQHIGDGGYDGVHIQ